MQVAHDAALATSGLTPSILRQNYRSLPIWFDPVCVREMVERDDRHRAPRGLGRAEAGRRTAPAHPGLRLAGGAHRGRQQPGSVGRLGDPQRGHPQRRHHQDAVERPADRGRHRPDDVRDGPGPPAHEAPRGRPTGRAATPRSSRAPLPARARREDRGVGRLRVGHPRDPLPAAGARDDRPRPQAERIDHRARGVRVARRSMAEVARRLACDVGTQNQEGCACARVVYVLSGTDAEGLARLDRLGELTYEAILDLPEEFSTKPLHFDDELRGYLDAQRMRRRLVPGHRRRGRRGRGRRVPPRRAGRLLPHPLGPRLQPRAGRLDRAGHRGGQRLHADRGHLPRGAQGGAARPAPAVRRAAPGVAGLRLQRHPRRPAGRHRALRRMCKWIVDEACDPAEVLPLWEKI